MNEYSLPWYAVVVAGGSGTRMGTAMPKQFLEVGGRPVLARTLERLHAAVPLRRLILVLPQDQIGTWQQLAKSCGCVVPHDITTGGPTRFASVQNGLALLEGDGIVAIHDGVRPFVSAAVVRQSFEEAAAHGSALTVVHPKESLRQVLADGRSVAAERAAFRIVQTPQTFDLSLIRAAYQQPDSGFTDDASVAEAAGHPIRLIAGNYENIKITTPEDLLWAESLVKAGF